VPGSRVRASGIGVATQFGLATAFTLAVSMIVFGFVVYRHVAGVLSDEIDAQGVAAARAAAIIDIDCWRAYHGTALDGKESEKDPILPSDPHQRETFEKRSAANRGRVVRMRDGKGTKILDAYITDVMRQTVLNGSGAISFRPEGPIRRIDDVEVQETTGAGAGARQFTRSHVRDAGRLRGGRDLGREDRRHASDLTQRIVTFTVIFIAIGAVGAWLVAKRVTRPISLLVQDIETVAAGDLTHRTHPNSTDEIGVLARTFDRMTQNLLGMQELERKQAAQEHQIEVAREVQAALLPE
jgi:HAMP domain-containing protein